MIITFNVPNGKAGELQAAASIQHPHLQDYTAFNKWLLEYVKGSVEELGAEYDIEIELK